MKKRITSAILVIILLFSSVLQAQQQSTGGGWFSGYSLPSFQRILNQGRYIFEWMRENPGKTTAGIGALALIDSGYLFFKLRSQRNYLKYQKYNFKHIYKFPINKIIQLAQGIVRAETYKKRVDKNTLEIVRSPSKNMLNLQLLLRTYPKIHKCLKV